jgi:hypothetical protein
MMIELIQREIKELRNEIKAIDYTSTIMNLKMTKFDRKQIMCAKAKMQVLNKVVMSFGVQD